MAKQVQSCPDLKAKLGCTKKKRRRKKEERSGEKDTLDSSLLGCYTSNIRLVTFTYKQWGL